MGDPVDVLARMPADATVLAMTHSHALDLAIVHAALAARRFASVGVIGSATKRARFVGRLRQAGLDAAVVDSLVCPVGLPGLGGKEPAVIAASVAAQLLLDRESARTAIPAGVGQERTDRHVG
jgi:xanthine dehydrogenase accessory factor